MKQSTFSAVMANSIKNLLQGYTKGIRFVAVLTMLLTMGIGQAWGAESTATLSFANKAQRTSFSTTKQVWEQNGVTFTNDKANSTNDIADYANPVRLYTNSKITITAPGNMTKIVFDCNSSSYATAMKNSIGTVSGATVTVSSDKVTVTFTSAVESFIIAKLTAQVRLDSLTVTYSAGCSYNINYITNDKPDGDADAIWSKDNCFEQEGSTTEWRYEMTLPGGGGSFWVGNGAWVNNKSEVQSLSTITFVGLQGTSCGKPYPGEGAVGYVRIYSNSGDKNYYAAFQPTYQIAFGIEGQTWTHKPFTSVSGNKYETDLLEIPSNFSSSYNYYVGPKKSDNTTIWVDGKSSTVAMNTMGGMTDVNAVKGSKGVFRIYDNSCDNNWYCSFIPYYNYKLLNDDGSVFYTSDYVSSEAANKTTTIYSTKPTKTGHTFVGWSRTQNATTAEVTAGASYTYWKANDTFYPVWKASYTVTFDLQGHGTAIPQQTVVAGNKATRPADPSATGYTFGGWYKESACTNVFDFNTVINANTTIYAKWTAKKYTYTLYPNTPAGATVIFKDNAGNSVDKIQITQTYGETAQSFANFYSEISCEGYRLEGWYSATSGGSKWTQTQSEPADNGVFNFYARWIKVHTITWKVNGQQYGEKQEVVDGQTIGNLPTKPSAPTSCSDKEFMGWTESATVNNDGTSITYISTSTKPDGDETYHAVFATKTTKESTTIIEKTKTETFENQSASTTYNSTQNYTEANSNAGIAWKIYYGTVSESDVITGSKSAQMRWYDSAPTNLPYIESQTTVSKLKSISYNVITSDADYKYSVSYSTNGTSWTAIATNQSASTTKQTKTHTINANGVDAYIKIAITSSSNVSDKAKFRVDDVTFTYLESTTTTTTTYTDYVTSCTPQYTITLNPNGGTFAEIPTGWNKEGNNYTITVNEGTQVYLPEPTHANNLDFVGWNDGTTNHTGNYTPTNNVILTAQWQCVAPTSVTVDGTYHFFPGETITITATPTGGSTPYTYQWQKLVVDAWTDIDQATTATYTKANATKEDVGHYRCVVSSGNSCTTTSNQYNVKCLQLYVYYNDHTDNFNLPLTKLDATTATASVNLVNAGYTYYFKLTDGCEDWYGNTGTMTSGDCTNWLMDANEYCGLTTTKYGDYLFTVDYSDLTQLKVSVTYPSGNQEAGKVIYWDNHDLQWPDGKIYYRIGHSTHNGKIAMTKVPGTANLYQVTTIKYDGFEAWHIANNGCWSEDNSIYKTNTGDDWAATAATAFITNPVTSAAVTVTPSNLHSTGGEEQNSNCEFYQYDIAGGMKKHNAKIIASPTGGTITVSYTDHDGTAKSDFTSGDRDLAHTCLLTITATPDAGYSLGTLTVNDVPFTSGKVHTLSADAEIEVVWEKKIETTLSWSAPTCTATIASPSNEFPTLTVTPEAIRAGVQYSSSIPAVATIDATGRIVLKSAGTTTIRAYYEEDNTYASAEDTYKLTVEESTNCRWEEVTIDDIEYGDEVVIAMEKNGSTYALKDGDGGAASAPLATQITINPNNTINTSETPISTPLIWNIDYDKEGTKNLVIYSTKNVGKWLYSINDNNGVRIGTNTNKEFKIVEGTGNDAGNFFLYHNAQARYLGVYYLGSDWRGYTSINTNITGQTLKLYKKVCLPEGQYRVTWMVNGQEYTYGNPTTIAVDGVIINIPIAPDDETLVDCEVNKFMGWSEDNIGSMPQQDAPTDLFTDIPTTPITENKTFYAVFAKVEGGGESITWKETFDTNEGTGGNDGQWSGTIASSELLSDHTWSFYNAKGASKCAKFASNSSGGSATTPAIDCSGSANATLTFKAGSWKGDETILNIESTNCTVDLTSVHLPDQKWEEYTINITNIIGKIKITFSSETKKRFFLDEVEITSSGGTSYSDYITLCDNSKVWAKYDLNGGTGASACTQTLVTKDAPFNLCSETPTKDGYTFNGWSDGTKTYAAGAEVIISKTTTFYATWKANTVTITWDLNYADSPEAATSEYVYDGDEIEMPADPTRTGYTFTGWYTTSTGGTEITEVGEENKPTSDVTYYAHWLELYTVTYMASGQVYVKQEYKYLSGDKLQLPENDPTAANFACDGYLFEGWSKYQQTKEDANRPELVDANTSVENDLELHAVWKKASAEGAGSQIFYESFDTENGTGGNDGKWSGDIAKNSKVNTTWTFENEGGAYQCIKLGSGSKKGSATTPALTQLSGDATLSFKAAAWNGNTESTTLKLSISGGGTLTQTSVTLVKGAWTTYEVQIKDGTPSSKITFEAANASNNRFFLDEVIITTSGSYNYTTVPNCGPTMVAKENVWVTSANGQSVKVNVPIGVKMFEGKATVTGTSTNENFVVNTLENVGNGEHNVVVVYTPTAEDIKENTTITLTAKNGEEIWSTTTFTLHGRSLPAEFVVVANKGDKNYALPANMPEAGSYAGFEVQVNGDEVIAAPKSHLYNLCAVHSTRYGENGTAVRLVGNDNACLWASSAAKSTDIRNWAKTDNAKATNYEWSLYTEDGDTYRISSTAVTEEGRVLRYNGEKFGMYKEGTDVLRLLPVGCSSTPLNVQVSPARVSAIVSWTNAGACELVVKQGGVTVVTLPSATSPAQVSNLAESTAYTFTLIPNDDASCGVSGAFTTTGPTIDIVEWQTDGIRIYVDKDENVNPKVIINGEEEHGNVGGQVATELFFSKYYEAHAENKLLAVYNGTTQTIDLNGYVIKHGTVEIDLSQYGQTKGFIASNEEIIFVSFDNDATKSAESCAEKEEGFSSWNVLETNLLAFSGRGSVGLYKNDVLIDLIGSIYPSGELTKIGKAGKPDYCGTEDDVQLYVDGVSVNDQSSFFCHNGDNIKTPEVETDYPISTNRCLLIRKNTVTSGATAVTSNKAEADATCGDLSSTFITLCTEWSGFRIGSGSSSTAEIQDATCEGLGYVGGFDYNNYYRTMETIYAGEELEEYGKNPDDNTYFIGIEDLAQYSCLNIQLQLTDNDGNVLADQISQVPILVDGKKTTTDELFSAIVNDGETPDYENSKIRCATCDVVILNGATLTKAAPDTPNDVNQVRDIYVYPGGKLIIPEGATDYSVNSVSLRRNQDDVSMADIQTPLNITSSSKTPVYVDVRINSKNWHWLSLPYNCNIADVTWKNGSKALYNSDWFLMYYDGESRVNEQSHYENHWKLFEGTTIEAGKGYIVGITGHATKSGVQYELRFPMAAEVLTHEKKDKTVAVNAWGVNMDVTPNKKGWNLVGNPYLDYYQPSTGGFAGLPLIKYTSMDPVTGEWHYDISGDVPFIVTPVDGGWYEYRQDLASEVDMKPFTSYFVQVGQPDSHEDDEELSASFTHSQRGRSSLIRRAPQEVNEVEEPIIVGVELTNSKGESDKTTLIIDDRFTSDYEMNADFFKWFGDYYKYYTKPVLYSVGADAGKRAFNALSEQLAAQPIPLGMFAAQAGDYTFTLTRKRCDLSRVEEVWLYDATTATYTNLMQQDYTFTTAKTEGEGRFYLSVKMKQKTPTAVENVNGNLSLVAHQQTLVLSGLPAEAQVWVYDATGKLLHSEHTTAYQRIYPVQQAGVYFVSVKGQGDAQTLSTIVK